MGSIIIINFLSWTACELLCRTFDIFMLTIASDYWNG